MHVSYRVATMARRDIRGPTDCHGACADGERLPLHHPGRTPPAANTPGQVVSTRSGDRDRDQLGELSAAPHLAIVVVRHDDGIVPL